MNDLNTPTGLYIGGQWLEPGAAVPGNVLGFDYEKAARKGMITAPEGTEIRNLTTPAPPVESIPAEAADQPTRVTELEGKVTTLTSERDEAQRKAASLGEQVGSLTTKLGEAEQKAQTSEADAQALAQYREVVGPLLPATDLQPRAYKSLLAHGYFTVKLVQGATDEALIQLPDVADGTVETLRRLYPAQG